MRPLVGYLIYSRYVPFWGRKIKRQQRVSKGSNSATTYRVPLSDSIALVPSIISVQYVRYVTVTRESLSFFSTILFGPDCFFRGRDGRREGIDADISGI